MLARDGPDDLFIVASARYIDRLGSACRPALVLVAVLSPGDEMWGPAASMEMSASDFAPVPSPGTKRHDQLHPRIRTGGTQYAADEAIRVAIGEGDDLVVIGDPAFFNRARASAVNGALEGSWNTTDAHRRLEPEGVRNRLNAMKTVAVSRRRPGSRSAEQQLIAYMVWRQFAGIAGEDLWGTRAGAERRHLQVEVFEHRARRRAATCFFEAMRVTRYGCGSVRPP